MDEQAIQKWLTDAASYLIQSCGLSTVFAPQAALLYLLFHLYGINPQITSGYRSPQKQEELMSRWLAGDPSVVAKPATNSLHCRTDFSGNPASEAIDIATTNPYLAAQIAKYINVGPGYLFNKNPDPVHFYNLKA